MFRYKSEARSPAGEFGSRRQRARSRNSLLSAIGNQAIQAGFGSRAIADSSAPTSHRGFESAAEDFASKDSGLPAGQDKLSGAVSASPVVPGGVPLDRGLQRKYSNRLGSTLSGVRIHDDTDAHAAAYALNARAFTRGNHIVFAANRYRPETSAGERLLAHELAHVIQQRQAGAPPLMRDGALWELEERDRRDPRCRSTLNWSDGGHWIGSGPEPDCGRDQPPQSDACHNRANWSDGGHWIGTGPEPDCRGTGTPGIEMRQSLQRVSDAYWARWERNRKRVLQTRDTAATDADALAALFRASMEDDGTAAGRLQTVLGQTRHLIIPGLQTGVKFGDTGFRDDFRDSAIWPSSGNQVGHFLTAVRLGYDPGFLDTPLQRYLLQTDDDVETMALKLIVGHEQKADPGKFTTFMSLIPFPGRWGFEEQYHSASDEDIENFRRGNLADVNVGTGKATACRTSRSATKGTSSAD